MKKVGLITFHRPINFGAALQAVALSKAIDALGAQCHLIDYRNPFFEKRYQVFRLPQKRTLKALVWTAAAMPNQLKMKKDFRKFIHNNANLTPPVKTKAALSAMGTKFDLYITGSDQVWNLDCSGGETAYFLDFVTQKPKNAYAASFGDAKVSEENSPTYQRLLSGFENISVRERSGIAVVQQITGTSCVQTVDPTLLLNQHQWAQIAKNTKRQFEKDYVLLYFMAATPQAHEEMMKTAKAIAKKRGCEVLVIGGSLHKQKDGIYYVNPTSPYAFLALFRDAAFVVTNSFHGTAFSVNFQKEFYSYVRPDLPVEGRVESLLKTLGLTQRIFSDYDRIPDVGEQPIAYEAPMEALERVRAFSMKYLQGVVYGQ